MPQKRYQEVVQPCLGAAVQVITNQGIHLHVKDYSGMGSFLTVRTSLMSAMQKHEPRLKSSWGLDDDMSPCQSVCRFKVTASRVEVPRQRLCRRSAQGTACEKSRVLPELIT
nr:hypothetical protein CFP56_64874 [Quercus suber]